MTEAVIIDAVRTPLGKKQGAFRQLQPIELYACVLDSLLQRTGVSPTKIEDVVTGCVTQVKEQGANLARQAVLLSNLPQTVPGTTVNRLCGSSQTAIHLAAQAVVALDAAYIIAGGVESMTRVPMFSDIGGGFETVHPKLRSKYEIIHQGESAERIASHYGLSRKVLDEFSFESHTRAVRAIQEPHLQSQLQLIQGLDADGKLSVLEYDEGIRFNPDLSKMGQLRPVFRPDGVITAANSSQISDGAAALLIADRKIAVGDGFKPRARFRARVTVAGDPTMQLLEVIPATKKALEKAHLIIKDIDVIEINEAFASVVLAWAREFKMDLERVNPNGGAIAHGHPLGATGAVLMTKLLFELERRDAQFGLQVMCIGHGMATATVMERI